MMQSINGSKYKVIMSLGVAWDRTVGSKQTLFPVWGDKEDRKAHKGIPTEEQDYTLRATKGVNMHPFPVIHLIREDGSKYPEEEEIKLTIVSAADKLPPPVGSCTCKGNPIISESKPFQLVKRKGDTFCKIRGGILELSKLQIGCCTGARGHGGTFCLKAEIVTEGSPLRGKIAYSLPIEVGAKGPFAKIFCMNQAAQQQQQQLIESAAVALSNAASVVSASSSNVEETSLVPKIPSASYEGAEEMLALLKKLNLQRYASLFLQQEIDIQAFLQLNDEDLEQMGITKVGPKVKIMREIERLRETALNASPVIPPLQLPAPKSSAPVPALPIQAPPTPNLLQVNNSPLPSEKMDTEFLPPMPMTPIVEEDGTSSDQPSLKRRRIASTSSFSNLLDLDNDKSLSIYIYLSNVMVEPNILKKSLFMVKSETNRAETEQIVQQIHSQLVEGLSKSGKAVKYEEKAQIMLMLQPDKNGDWVAKSNFSEQLWNFRKGDYIKIDNHHNVDVCINVHYYYISGLSSDKPYIEDFRSPKKYPILFPGGSLEIGIDENRDGRLALAGESFDFEPAETFAVTKNGKILIPTSLESMVETCNFSFKRRKESMKKVESFDEFQREIFLQRCLDQVY